MQAARLVISAYYVVCITANSCLII